MGGGTCFRTLGNELLSTEQTEKDLLVDEGELGGVARGTQKRRLDTVRKRRPEFGEARDLNHDRD